MEMECPRCHNKNIQHLYKMNGRYYCRKCINFQRIFVDEGRESYLQNYPIPLISYRLDFDLSLAQKKISQQLVSNYQHGLDSLVLAVCGSGKTEIVFELIKYALSLGQRVCFCIPRKELVVELYDRIHEAFQGIEIGLFYGGHHGQIDAQFIICTMHQLYRFENSRGFDLMIADEVDAFPFYNNSVLNEIFENCCLGHYVKLSATFEIDELKNEQLLIMNRRYHGKDLPIPHRLICPHFLQKFVMLYLIKKMKKKTIVFVPTVSDTEKLCLFLNKHFIKCKPVSSKHIHNQEVLDELKAGKIQVIVATTLLERGVTVEDVQVIVYQSEHQLFDKRTLIQIAGRVGRKPNHPTGHVYFLTSEKTAGITQCISTIKKLNQMCV